MKVTVYLGENKIDFCLFTHKLEKAIRNNKGWIRKALPREHCRERRYNTGLSFTSVI